MDNHYVEMKRNIGINLNYAENPIDSLSDILHKIPTAHSNQNMGEYGDLNERKKS